MDKLEETRIEYHKLTVEADEIIEGLTVRDDTGRITESGYSTIYSVQRRLRAKEDISEAVEIIGREKWERLTHIWQRLQVLAEEDKKLRRR